MACCGTGCGGGYGGYGNQGGYGYGHGQGGYVGNDGVLSDAGTNKMVHIKDHGCSTTYPTPYLTWNGDFCVSCHEVCASECCTPCTSGGVRGGDGGYAPALKVDIQQAGCSVYFPHKYLCSCYQCANVRSTSDACGGPC